MQLRLKTTKRFGILARVSTKGQSKGESLDEQERRGRDYAKRHGGQVVRVFKGVESATRPLDERELLQRVLREAERHAFDALWVIDKSRLSRSPGTTEVVLAQFAKLRIELHTAQGPVANGSAEAGFLNIIEAAADLLGARRSRERVLQAFETKLANGEHSHGRGPWGRKWDKTRKVWNIDPEARRQARQLYRMCVIQGLGTVEIGQRLGWPATTVGERLHSAGRSRWPRTLMTLEGLKSFDLSIPALLTSVQAAAIERRLKANLSVMPEHKNRSLLQGLIRCGGCGGNLSHATSGDRRYETYRHLASSHRKGCTYQVPAPLIERDVVAVCGELLASSAKLKSAIEAALKDATGDLKDAKTELSDVQGEIHKLESAHKRCLDGLVYFDHSERERKKLADEAKQISARLETLRGTHEGLRVKLGKSSAQDPARVAAQMRRLFGLRGLAVLSLPKEKQRELVLLTVARASKESPEGIYVRNAAMANGRPAAWEWRLQGSLGLLTGTASNLVALQEDNRARLRPDLATPSNARRFAQLGRIVGNLNPRNLKALFRCSACTRGDACARARARRRRLPPIPGRRGRTPSRGSAYSARRLPASGALRPPRAPP